MTRPSLSKHYLVKWTADGKPYEFLYSRYATANQMAHDLIRDGYEPIIVVRFVK